MMDLKKQAIGGIKNMLEERLANRMKPKSESPKDEEAPEIEGEAEELPESDGLEMVPEGADVSKLSPEELQQLKDLYAKMGC